MPIAELATQVVGFTGDGALVGLPSCVFDVDLCECLLVVLLMYILRNISMTVRTRRPF